MKLRLNLVEQCQIEIKDSVLEGVLNGDIRNFKEGPSSGVKFYCKQDLKLISIKKQLGQQRVLQGDLHLACFSNQQGQQRVLQGDLHLACFSNQQGQQRVLQGDLHLACFSNQ